MTQLPEKTSTSTSQPIAPIDRTLSDAVAAILNTAEQRDGETVVTVLPSPALRQAITVRQDAIRRALMPLSRSLAEKERAAKAVAAVLAGWVNAKVSDPKAKAAAYVATLGDLPCWVVEQVCREVARGHVEGLDPDFPPSAARLHQLGENAITRLRKEAADLAAVKDAKLEEIAATPQQRERLHMGFQKLKSDLQRGYGVDAEAVAKARAEDNKAAIERQQARVRAEYERAGLTPPHPLALSLTARRELGIPLPHSEANHEESEHERAGTR